MVPKNLKKDFGNKNNSDFNNLHLLNNSENFFPVPENVSRVLDRLTAYGYEAFLTGGCVRDIILGKVPCDYDISTPAEPEQIKSCFYDYNIVETGIKYGTVTVVSGGDNIEVTAFRKDGEYNDCRHPGQVFFSKDLRDDLSRRDFTINAMAYSKQTGIIDVFGGLNDLRNRIIKCVGEPFARFNEDALRILRALRFASELGFKIDSKTSAAVHELKNLLGKISKERISGELNKLICGVCAAEILIEYSDVIGFIIPEIKPCVNFNQHNKHHIYNVWEHTAAAVGNSVSNLNVRLALLFHDISKPLCFKKDKKGSGHFYGHDKISAGMAEAILRRLKYSNKITGTVADLIKNHNKTPDDSVKNVKHLLSDIGEERFFELTEVIKGDNKAKHISCMKRVQEAESMANTALKIIDNNECYKISMLGINGNDLASIGISGEDIGKALRMLLNAVIDEIVTNNRPDLINFIKRQIIN